MTFIRFENDEVRMEIEKSVIASPWTGTLLVAILIYAQRHFQVFDRNEGQPSLWYGFGLVIWSVAVLRGEIFDLSTYAPAPSTQALSQGLLEMDGFYAI